LPVLAGSESHLIKEPALLTAEKDVPTPPNFRSFVPPETYLPELTWRAVLLGAVLSIIFGATSAYLGLRVGLTVSASIPSAVIAMLLFRSRTYSPILENNIVQTIGSAGESIAAGVVFTVPALIFLGFDLDVLRTFLLALTGGVMGILFTIPLRRYLIIKEHGRLLYPEGTACAEILMAGQSGGVKARNVFTGLGIGALYKFCMGGDGGALKFWNGLPTWTPRWYPGSRVNIEVSPELLGIGYVIGYRTSALMVAGGVLSWLVLIPMLRFFGQASGEVILPATKIIRLMSVEELYRDYVKYMGAGAVTAGGIFSMVRAMPSIISSFKASVKQLAVLRSGKAETVLRTDRDIPITVVVVGCLLIVGFIWLLPQFQVNLVSAFLIVLFGFFFAVVSSRLTGQIGSSSCPNSGMAVATLIGTCLIFVALGLTGDPKYLAMALSVGAIVCIASSNAGTTSQDLKTGFLVGATPIYQQTGLIIGVLTSVLVIGWTVVYLNKNFTTFEKLQVQTTLVLPPNPVDAKGPDGNTYKLMQVQNHALLPDGKYLVVAPEGRVQFREIPGIENLQAPQAKLMSVVIKGILDRKLPWGLILFGILIAIVVELCGVHSLAFAVGVYLSLSSTMPIFVGGLVRKLADRLYRRTADDAGETEGTLFSSGLIAGGALVGIVVAGIVGAGQADRFSFGERWFPALSQNRYVALAIFGLLASWLLGAARTKR
jgi:putative OPT family oligopeptide transporter